MESAAMAASPRSHHQSRAKSLGIGRRGARVGRKGGTGEAEQWWERQGASDVYSPWREVIEVNGDLMYDPPWSPTTPGQAGFQDQSQTRRTRQPLERASYEAS